MGAKPLIVAGSCLLLACLCAACGSATPPASATTTPPSASAAAPVRTATVPPPATDPPATAPAPASRCPQYPAATYGIDPNRLADTGGGAQLVTVVDPSPASVAGTLTAWARIADGCWSPASFPGQPAQPFRAQTGYGGLRPIAQRVPGDRTTPTGLFPFGTNVYGNSTVSPTTRYPYHHLVCGD